MQVRRTLACNLEVIPTMPIVKVKVLVSQSCLTLSDPMDCRPPSSSVHGILQQEYWHGYHSLHQRPFLTQGSNPGLLHCRQILYWLSLQKSPKGRWVCPFPSRFLSRCPKWATGKFSGCSSLLSILHAGTLHAIQQICFLAFL